MGKKGGEKIIYLNGQLEFSLIIFVLLDLRNTSLNFTGEKEISQSVLVERSSRSLLAPDLGHNMCSKPAVIKQKPFSCLLKVDMVSYPRSMNILIITANYFFL